VFYRSGIELTEAEIRTGPHMLVGECRPIFQYIEGRFAAAADGQRFLMMEPLQNEPDDLMAILNWPAGLRRP
jgi:hypothetical protein